MEVLKDHGKQIVRVYPKELRRVFQNGTKALLLGRLNFSFQPWRQRTANRRVRSPSRGFLLALPNHTARAPPQIEWLIPACKGGDFYGLEAGDEEDGDENWHATAIAHGKLFCHNLVDASGERFDVPAKKVLPLTRAADGQYRVKAGSQLAYLLR